MSENSLYARINHTFNKSELRTLCFELGIDSEELLDEWRKSDFVRELILYCRRRNHLPALLEKCRALRSNEDWPDSVQAIELGLSPVPFWQRSWLIGVVLAIFLITAITVIFVNIGGESLIAIFSPTATPTITPIPTDTPLPTATLLPTITPLPFEAEKPGETLIVIATFHRTEGVDDAEAQNEIQRAIELEAAKLNFVSLRVEVDPIVLRSEDRIGAETLGEQYNASMVIWGDETAVRVTVNFLNLKEPDFAASQVEINETQRTQLANPEAYASFITEDLPGQLTFLSLFAVGQSYYIQENYEAAIQVIETAVGYVNTSTLPTEATEAHYQLGWLYQTTKRNEQAILAYNQTIELNPAYAFAYNNRGVALSDQGDLAGAIADYNKAIELDPNYAVAYSNRGAALSDQGDLAGAMADYNKAIELDPNDAEAYNNRGVALYEQGDLDGAIADYNKAIELDPNDAIAYNNRGNALSDQGDLAGAMADYNKTIELDPNDAIAYYSRGRALYEQGDLDGAIADYNKAIELDPNYAIAYNNRGIALADQGDLDGAIADYNKAIELDPNFALAYNNRGGTRAIQGDLDGAMADCNKAIELDPNLAMAYGVRGLVRLQSGDPQGALEDLRYYLELNPTAENREILEELIAELEAELGE